MHGIVTRWSAASDARWTRVNAGIVIALILFLFYYLGVRPTESFTEPRQVDFQYYYLVPSLIFEHLEYPSLIPNAGTLGWITGTPFGPTCHPPLL